MTSGRRERFCVVGLGGHARTKLVPAIEANGQKLLGIVSCQPANGFLPEVARYRNIGEALAALPADVCFLIATPPSLHFEQAQAALRAGRDTIVEKPAFVTAEQARMASGLARAKGTVLVEAFMHRHTKLYERLLADWTEDLDSLTIDFTIPAMPEGTFRQGADIANSALFDMGCYVLSLLVDVGFPLGEIRLAEVRNPGTAREKVLLASDRPFPMTASIGVAPEYANIVRLERGEEWTAYSPFFYGRSGERRIESDAGVSLIEEGNAFEAMLRTTRRSWLASQEERDRRMIEITEKLQSLGTDLLGLRASSR